MADRYVAGLLAVDQRLLALTTEQAAKAKEVLTAYAAKYNAMSQKVTSVEEYKAGIRALDIERIKLYKTFLDAGQYANMVAAYNKFHPKSPVEL